MKLSSIGFAFCISCSLSSAWAVDELLWNGEAPKNAVKNPVGPSGIGHTEITPNGYIGPGMLGDWFDAAKPFNATNPVIEFDRGGAQSDPSTLGQALQFWYRVSPEIDHLIVQIRSWDTAGGRYVIRIENPSTTWTQFEFPFALMIHENGITSADHIVFDQDANGPGQVWVDEVWFVKAGPLVNPALPAARSVMIFVALLLAGIAALKVLTSRNTPKQCERGIE